MSPECSDDWGQDRIGGDKPWLNPVCLLHFKILLPTEPEPEIHQESHRCLEMIKAPGKAQGAHRSHASLPVAAACRRSNLQNQEHQFLLLQSLRMKDGEGAFHFSLLWRIFFFKPWPCAPQSSLLHTTLAPADTPPLLSDGMEIVKQTGCLERIISRLTLTGGRRAVENSEVSGQA